MLDIFGNNADLSRSSGGLSRRDFLRVGAIGTAGLTLGHFGQLRADEEKKAPATSPKAKSVILLWLAGGPSHIDMFDPKPRAGADYDLAGHRALALVGDLGGGVRPRRLDGPDAPEAVVPRERRHQILVAPGRLARLPAHGVVAQPAALFDDSGGVGITQHLFDHPAETIITVTSPAQQVVAATGFLTVGALLDGQLEQQAGALAAASPGQPGLAAQVTEMLEALGQQEEQIAAQTADAQETALVGRLMQEASRFRQLVQRQTDLVRRLERYAEGGAGGSIRLLGALGKEQDGIRAALETFTRDVATHANALPAKYRAST